MPKLPMQFTKVLGRGSGGGSGRPWRCRVFIANIKRNLNRKMLINHTYVMYAAGYRIPFARYCIA